MTADIASRIGAAVRKCRPVNGIRIVGVDGPSGSGTVVLEGVTCTRRETVGRLVYAIWVEASPDIRLARGMARDSNFPGKEDLWRQWTDEENEFFTTDGTRERADIIVDTSVFGLATTT